MKNKYLLSWQPLILLTKEEVLHAWTQYGLDSGGSVIIIQIKLEFT